MAKLKKKARVRYDDGKVSGKEQYALEFWSEADGKWHEDMATRFVADAKHPESGDEFVHYSLVTRIIDLVNQGYDIDI